MFDRKKYMKAYHKAYQNSDAYKAYQKAYQNSDAYKAYHKAYRKSDAYKASQKAYNDRRGASTSNLKAIYQKQLEKCEQQCKQYTTLPVQLEGRLIMLKEIIVNLDIIDRHVATLDKNIREETRNVMIARLLGQEGILVSRRKKLANPMARA